MKGMGYFQNLRNFLDISGNFLGIFLEDFFEGFSLEEFFDRSSFKEYNQK